MQDPKVYINRQRYAGAKYYPTFKRGEYIEMFSYKKILLSIGFEKTQVNKFITLTVRLLIGYC